MVKNLLLISCATILLNGCFGGEKEEKWTAFIYPIKEDTKKYVKSPITFNSLEECKKVSILEIQNQKLENIAFFKALLQGKWKEAFAIFRADWHFVISLPLA